MPLRESNPFPSPAATDVSCVFQLEGPSASTILSWTPQGEFEFAAVFLARRGRVGTKSAVAMRNKSDGR